MKIASCPNNPQLTEDYFFQLPQPIASLANGEPEFIRWSQQAGVEGYDAARVYLAKWASIVAAQGERSRRAEFNDWDPEPVANDSPLSSLDGGFEMIHVCQ
jgi:hypothetical protein